MNARTGYDASTPDRATFVPVPSPGPTPPQSPSRSAVFIPAPAPVDVDVNLDASLSRDASSGWRMVGARTRMGALGARVQKVWGNAGKTVKNNTGMLLIAASQCFFSLMNVSVKKLNSVDPPVPAFELIWVRMAITWICCVTYMSIMKVPDPWLGPKGVRLLLAFRGFIGFFGLFGIYFSLQYLSLSDATVLTFLAPLCTAGAAALFLGERMTARQVGAGVCSLAGVVLIARPEFLFGRAAHAGDVPLDPPVHLNATLGGINGTLGALTGANGTSTIVEAAGSAGVTPAQRVMAVGVLINGGGHCILHAADTTIRAIGKRAHPLHNLVSFSSQCVIVSTVA
ncbi:hypothetical protein EIP86_007063 [Pleurotus ostreatoroseus]|nr:hypothetical protein EIP86_007063 [Pleurotus ostreatoroseus]